MPSSDLSPRQAAPQLQELGRQLDEAEVPLSRVRFAVLRCQRLRDRLRHFVAQARAALEPQQQQQQQRQSILHAQHLDTIKQTVEATKQLFVMLSRISVFDYFVRSRVWNNDIAQLNVNIVVCHRETGLVASLAQYEHEDATDKRLDEQAFASLIRRVGGVKESLKREAVGVDPRDAQALAGAFAKIRESSRYQGMGFEATFLRNGEQILRARAGLATPLSPLQRTPPSPYLASPREASFGYTPPSPSNVPRRRASISRGSNFSSSVPSRPSQGQPSSFFMPNASRTGPSDMSRPFNTPPSSSTRASFGDTRPVPPGLFSSSNTMEDDIIRRAASLSVNGRTTPVPVQGNASAGSRSRTTSASSGMTGGGSQSGPAFTASPGGSRHQRPRATSFSFNGASVPNINVQRPSNPGTPGQRTPAMHPSPNATPREPPVRRGSGVDTVLSWEDARTRREMIWRPFDVWHFWEQPGWLTRVEAVDHGVVTPGTKVEVVSEWKATSGALAKAVEGRRTPTSRLRRLHVEIGSHVTVVGIFKLRDEIVLGAWSHRRVGEGGTCAYGLIPLSALSVSGRKPATQPRVLEISLHESAFSFNAHVRSNRGLVPIEGVVMGEPSPAIQFRRTDEESSPLQGPTTAIVTSALHKITGARKRAEVREVKDNFGASHRQNVWIFEYKVQTELGSHVTEMLFFDESRADEVVYGAKKVCGQLNIADL